jgi:hypothetical protein
VDDNVQKAFDFAQESTKQLITLAAGIIALSITFSKDFVGQVSPAARSWALLSWGVLLVSIFFGLWTLLALTGSLEPKDGSTRVSTRGTNVTVPSALQILTFFIGLVLIVVFGIVATRGG